MSHAGNVFGQGFKCQKNRRLSPNDLRIVRVMKAIEEVSA